MNYPRTYSLTTQYLFIGIIMIILYGMSLSSMNGYYCILFTMAIGSYFKIKNRVTALEIGCIFAYTINKNIYLDLVIYLVISLLTLYRVTIRGETATTRITLCMILAVSLASLYFESSRDNLFSALSICSFSSINIFKDYLFSKRLLIEYTFALFFIILLQVSETYLIACLMVSFLTVKQEGKLNFEHMIVDIV